MNRQELRAQYDFRCGYCGVAETDVGSEMTTDHFQPRSRGGTEEPDNLVYCCHACNEFKGDYWSNQEEARLLHPLQDDIQAHLDLTTNFALRAWSPRGANHIAQLRLNRPSLVANRRLRAEFAATRRQREQNEAERQAALAERETLLQELKAARTAISRLIEELSRKQA